MRSPAPPWAPARKIATLFFRRCNSSSTSALVYKAIHRRRPLLLPKIDPPSWSPADAVTNILYNTPNTSAESPVKRHVLNCLVQNEPGVLSRVSGILAARGFNIDSLVVCTTEVKDLSRMAIALKGPDGVIEQARRQLEDLVPVWAVLDYTKTRIVERELFLCKVSILGPEHFDDLLAHHRAEVVEGNASPEVEPVESKAAFHPVNLAPSEALRHRHAHLQAVTSLARQFGGKVVDISTDTCIVELSAKPSRVDALMHLLKPFGILEAARSGMMALPRAPLDHNEADIIEKDAEDIVDASMLPPG
ncbi:Acetolactate synthase small subunit, mitochondrial [Neolecta irregularis DAH-3]|uniref:Acetolactate synthase small subunit, mitochondrial n=1 Tax=Neolecta irregularis (strain DAH-3) TaxID=1198029 RepID=A0A1U7LIY2_NEOID|nr:Acetolactate synthase small subunit, mitochondrial [Neolecta irregularis DAH-3]|eukprot:OLL22553.1 Acetolactate synthase small subunit, mitochondrial [Neolecta irregularis DAH-3]